MIKFVIYNIIFLVVILFIFYKVNNYITGKDDDFLLFINRTKKLNH